MPGLFNLRMIFSVAPLLLFSSHGKVLAQDTFSISCLRDNNLPVLRLFATTILDQLFHERNLGVQGCQLLISALLIATHSRLLMAVCSRIVSDYRHLFVFAAFVSPFSFCDWLHSLLRQPIFETKF